MDRHFWDQNESRVAKLIESLETCDRISCRKESSERKSSDLEKDKILENVLKRGEVEGGDLTFFGLVKYGE